MKPIHLCAIGLALALFLPATEQALAQSNASQASSVGGSACRVTVEQELAKEQRIYRSVLLGHTKAKDAPVGEVRYDKEGIAWIRTEKNKWKTVAKGYESTVRTDTQMDDKDELKERRGILETRGVLTSDLVPYLTQSFRALQCRIDLVCRTAELSTEIKEKNKKRIDVSAPGCMEEERDSFPSCHLVAGEASRPEGGDILTYCRNVGRNMLAREEDLLRLTVEYDAAYRSLLQLAGNFDTFLGSFEWSVSHLLRQAADIVGSLQRIPCFIASCDPQPPSSQASP